MFKISQMPPSSEFLKNRTENLNQRLKTTPKSLIRIREIVLKNSEENKPNLSRKPLEALSDIKGSQIRWKQGDLIGTGSCGQVYRAMNCATGQIFAVKKVNIQCKDQGFHRALEREMAILKRLNHPNIIKCYGYETLEENVHFYMEYVPGGIYH